MFFNRLLTAISLIPATGDRSDVTLIILAIAGGLCVAAVVAMLLLPKLSKKNKEEQPQVEEIDQE